MDGFTYLIIGGGVTAYSAVQGIRSKDFSGKIGIITEEQHTPYDRPPLSKGLWFGTSEDTIYKDPERENVKLLLGKKVVAIDAEAKTVTDNEGKKYHYEKLLLATGGLPRHLECPDEGVIYLRTIEDYHRLRGLYQKGNHFVVIGGGFIGPEIASAFTMNGKNVTLIIKDPSLWSSKIPRQFSQFLSDYFTEQGVKILPHQTVQSICPIHEAWKVITSKGENLFADGVIAGIGIIPQITLAESIGAKIEDGVVVDEFLNTSIPHIWAAGDIARFYSPHLKREVRMEHEDTAHSMGNIAGQNMAGTRESYTYLPYFYSDLFDLSIEGIGEVSSQMEIMEDWIEAYQEGTVYYLKDGKVRGGLVVNVKDQIPKIRKMIEQNVSLRSGIEH